MSQASESATPERPTPERPRSERQVTVYHNPACTTSRKVVALLEEAGAAPRVVEYLKVGWTGPQLRELLTRMGASARDILRVRGTPAEELGLTAPDASDEAILEAMIRHPILVNRPIVVGPRGAALARPPERALELI
ncbi:MAG: arsenate reductase (glutaredoxin) [Alphaproteobacteria bacterium]|nr:arsenate reductase (glutaredoxin) [Alphaproteobacteria bacterium]